MEEEIFDEEATKEDYTVIDSEEDEEIEEYNDFSEDADDEVF